MLCKYQEQNTLLHLCLIKAVGDLNFNIQSYYIKMLIYFIRALTFCWSDSTVFLTQESSERGKNTLLSGDFLLSKSHSQFCKSNALNVKQQL